MHQSHSEVSTQPRERKLGELIILTVFCGGSGAMLAIILDLAGVFSSQRTLLRSLLVELQILSPERVYEFARTTEYILVFFSAISLAFAILDSAALWRKVFLLTCSVFLAIGAVFSLALWHWWIFPSLIMTGIISSSLLSIIFARRAGIKLLDGRSKEDSIPIREPRVRASESSYSTASDPVESIPIPVIGQAQKDGVLSLKDGGQENE